MKTIQVAARLRIIFLSPYFSVRLAWAVACGRSLPDFYALIDMAGFRRLAWPLVVVGMNSIVMYVMSQLLKGWVTGTLKRHFGEDIFTAYGHLDPIFTPATQMVGVLVVFWLVCVWLYRQKIFVRI